MKKICFLLGVVFVSTGFSQFGFAGDPCKVTPGKKCFEIKPGGDAEESICFEKKKRR